MSLEIQKIRSRFPSLTYDDGNPIFFDNPAGTQVPKAVMDAVTDYYMRMNANAGGTFRTSHRNDEMEQRVRQIIADFLNAPSADEIVLGPNMTTLNFGLSRALAKTLKAGDEIVVTRMDHDANVSPWLRIAEDYDLVIRRVDINVEDCTLDMDSLEAALTDRTKVVAVVHASNAVGTINPIKRIIEMGHAAGAYTVVDAVQSAPHVPLDVQEFGCDFLLCSAYKFFGPHIGVMWGKYDLLASLPAYKVRPSKDKPPYRWETGTASFETINGVGAALEYIASVGEEYGQEFASEYTQYEGQALNLKLGMAVFREYEQKLTKRLLEILAEIDSVTVYGITDFDRLDERVPTVAFRMDGVSSHDIAQYLADNNIYVWSGHYYAVEIVDRLGFNDYGMVRVGLAHYNTMEEVKRFGEVLKQYSA